MGVFREAEYIFVRWVELELFAGARRWEAYLEEQLRPFLGPTMLEVGAGLGAPPRRSVGRGSGDGCLSNPMLRLRQGSRSGARQEQCRSAARSWSGPWREAPGLFDSVIIYIDVFEHIEHDRDELARARRHLRSGGHLIVLSPAHPWLYFEFDRSICHFRRYTAASLRAIAPADLRVVRLRYLDSVGALFSAANRLLLRQALSTAA